MGPEGAGYTSRMNAVPRLLVDLALVLGVGTLTGLLFRWLKLPVVLGYVLAGMLVGPHVPVPLVADERNVQTLADLGVTLLMFGVGLEFSPKKLFQAGPTALLMGSIQVGLTAFLGAVVARAFGRTPMESLFIGAALTISSTMLLTKVLQEHPVPRSLRDAALSLTVVHDLFGLLLLTVLAALANVGNLQPAAFGGLILRLGLFLGVVLVLGRMVVPRFLRWAADHASAEFLLVASAGLCFSLALGAAAAGFSLALGAFLAGSLGAESGRVRAIERQVGPLRDLFTAVFFVAVGMMLVPSAWVDHLPLIIGLALAVVAGNSLGIGAGGLLAGLPFQTSLRTGMALSQMGEFGYILLGVGIAAGAVRPELYSVGVAVGVVTAFASPFLLKASGPFAEAAEARIPTRLRASLGLYQAWAESLRRRGIRHGEGQGLRRPTLLLLLDTVLLLGLVGGSHLLLTRWTAWLEHRVDWGHFTAQGLVAGLLGLGAGLLVLGMLRQVRVLARDLAVLAPSPETVGSGRRGRHLLAGGLRVAVLLMVGLPLVAVLQPFAPKGPLLGVALAVFLGTLAYQLWKARRLNRELPGVLEWILAKVRDPWAGEGASGASGHGTLRAIRLGPRCPSLGRRLGDLDLTGRAGVSIVALLRNGQTSVALHPTPLLQVGDLLALAGPEHALDEAEALLGQPAEPGKGR